MNYTGEERRADPTGIRDDIFEIKTDVKEIKDKFQKVIYGNDEPGLKVKVDRNTSFRKAVVWAIGILFGGGIVTTVVLAAVGKL